MSLRLLPLLESQRELYAMPRGWERFRAYIRTMTGGTEDLELPLVSMNPMGKEHVGAHVARLLALDAEAVAGQALGEAEARLGPVAAELKVGLVVCDDLKGGWTNRFTTELGNRFEPQALLRRGFVTVLCWTSEEPDRETVHRETLAAVHRNLHLLAHGGAETLTDRMRQEGRAMAFAGMTSPVLDPEDLAYSREVIAPHRGATDRPTQVACLFGDEAARSLGYQPLGLSPRAGFALALVEERSNALAPW